MKQDYMGYYNEETGDIIITKKITNYIGKDYVPLNKRTIEKLVKEIIDKRKSR